jgi:hypothetical protein
MKAASDKAKKKLINIRTMIINISILVYVPIPPVRDSTIFVSVKKQAALFATEDVN